MAADLFASYLCGEMKDLSLQPQSPPAQVVSGDGARSFRSLYDAEVGYVGRTLMRFGVERRDLDDVIQEVFIVVYRRRADYDAKRPLRPWLCGIAFRVASDWRRRAAQRDVPTEDVEPSAPEPTADRHLLAHEAVLQGLAGLSFEHRSAIVLCDLEGHTAAEAGALLGVPAGTIYSRLHEARRAFVAAVRAKEAP